MRNPRFLTAAGSAVAASIAIGAFLWIAPRHSVVQASTILRSFRQSLLDGFRLSMKDVGAEGVRVNGDFCVRFRCAGVDADGPLDPSRIEPDAVGFELAVRADDSADADVRGLDVVLAGSFSPASQWVYLRVENLPEEVIQDEPLAMAFLPMLRNGVFLQLDGLQGALTAPLGDLFDDVFKAAPAQEPVSDPPLARMSWEGAGRVMTEAPKADAFDKLAEDLLYGRAGPEHLDELATLIEKAARQAEVVDLGGGLYRLTARDFTRETSPDDADFAMLQRIEANITYRRGAGVESAQVLNIGDYEGAIQFGPLSDTAGAARDAGRYVDGATTVLDLGSLAPMIEQLLRSEAD